MASIKCCRGDGNQCSSAQTAVFVRAGRVSIVDELVLAQLVSEEEWDKAVSEPLDDPKDMASAANELLSRTGGIAAEEFGIFLDKATDDYVVVHCEPCGHVCKVRIRKR